MQYIIVDLLSMDFLRYTCFLVVINLAGYSQKKINASSPQTESRNEKIKNHIRDGQSDEAHEYVLQTMTAYKNRTEMLLLHKIEDEPVDYLFQEDIVLSPRQAQAIYRRTFPRQKRKLTSNLALRWDFPLMYTFDGGHSPEEIQVIESAIRLWEVATCVRFQHIKDAEDIIEHRKVLQFMKNDGCWSFVGREGNTGFQSISVGNGCATIPQILHELGHVVGFWHEHSRPDRDENVLIHYENIRIGRTYNFQTLTWKDVMVLNIPYDVESVMHYGSKDFSKNNGITIETRDQRLQKVLGQSQNLSFYDSKLANMAFCQHICKHSPVAGKCLHDGYPDPNKCHVCRCTTGLGGTTCNETAEAVGDACGGTLYASSHWNTIESPGYPNTYRAGQFCSWFIKAPVGCTIYIHFEDEFNITCLNDYSCSDYVEVRYATNLGATGGRYCCSGAPNETIKSDTNEMLVVFRSFMGGQAGFRAVYSTESCGGCGEAYPLHQKACVTRMPFRCAKSWIVRQKSRCPSWWIRSNWCGGFIWKKMARYGTCYRDVPRCCDGFLLSEGFCYAVKWEGFKDDKEKNGSVALRPVFINGTSDKSLPGDWTEWSKWSQCNRSCGGCGVQLRTRTCDDTNLCGGNTTETDSRSCNKQRCPQNSVQWCSVNRLKQALCGDGTFRICTVYRKSVEITSARCCCDYEESGDVCVKKND